MFYYCSALTSLEINFKTSKVIDMSYLFMSCGQLTSLNLKVSIQIIQFI